MASTIKGITIEFGGDTTKLDKALSDVNKNSRSLQSELKQVNNLLKLDPKNTELVAQKQKILASSINETKDKLNVLKTAESQVQAQFEKGEVSEEQYRALQREIVSTETKLKSLETEAKAMNNISLDKVAQGFENVGGKCTNLGNKLLPVTAAVGALATASIASCVEMDNGYDTVITKTGATGTALEDLKGNVDSVFTNLPTSAEEAGIAVGEVNTRFGLTGKACEDLSSDFIKFANINDTDLNTSIDNVDAIMTKFGVDSSQTKNVLGLMTKAGQDTGLSMDTLQNSLSTNGATLKEMGLDLTGSVNLLSQFEANGVDASTALAGLKKAQQNATAEGKTLSESLGETIEGIKGASSETDALQIATELFGKKGAAEMTQAIREGRLSVDDLTGSLEDYGTTVDDTFEATQDPWDQAKVALNNLKLAGSDLATTLLTSLQPTITKIVDKVKEFTTWFTNLDEKHKQMIIKIAAVVAAIGPALIVVGKLSTGIGKVISTVSKLSSGVGVASKVLTALTGPVGIVIGIIAALAAGFVYLYKTNDTFREKCQTAFAGVKESFAKMKEAIAPAIEALKQAFQSLMTALQPVFEFLMTAILGIVNGLMAAAQPIISAITNVIQFVTNIIQAVIALFTGDFDGFFSYLGAAFQNIISFITNIITAIVNFIVGFFQTFGVNVKQIFSDIWNGIVSIFSGVGQWFSDRFTEAYTFITTIFSGIGQWFSDRWTDITTALAAVGTWFQTMFQTAYTNVTTIFSAIGGWFTARWTDITTAFAAVGTWFQTMFQTAYTNITNVFSTIGGWFTARWNDITTAFSSVGTWFSTKFQEAYTGVTTAFSNVGKFFSGIWDNIKGIFTAIGTNVGDAIGGAFKSVINGVLQTVENTINGAIGFINTAIGVINKIPGVNIGSVGTVSLPRMAKGGTLKEGSAIMAEAGPEIISMVNGEAVVTPLTPSARNTALENVAEKGETKFEQNLNIYSNKELSPSEVARQNRIATRRMIAAIQRG